MAEYRLYGEPNCNMFSIIGPGELEQSKSLGLVLSQSEMALNALINLLHLKSQSLKLCKLRNTSDCVIIDCEMRQNLENNNSNRADVVVRVYDNKNGSPKFAILIETKRKGTKISEEGARGQVKSYEKTFEELKKFGEDIILVTLTDIRTIFSDKDSSVISLTWGELITTWDSINDSIVKDYINYLLKINGNMKQYDKEVLSIPAANSYKQIKESGIYCCPVRDKGPYKRRAESHPLYLACRQKGSIITELFKIKDIIRIYRPIEKNIEFYLIKTYGEKIVNNLVKYWVSAKREYSFVFIFDTNSTILLPSKIKLKNGNTYSKDLTLKQVFSPEIDDIVEIVK